MVADPEDAEGPKTDMYYPVNRMGIWVAGADIVNRLDHEDNKIRR